ncbi:MAG: GDSL-type esterase/lipase family protein [Sediminibacterium sp.]|uniref:SGNH/GDSL hydrolase family protein n=1 Tax=Sediminibacterium sp. TaxID=1917865 RepID=UPI0027226E87|nr:GDSL-type esterase/lipase family protein [Sediminibacterium sp.]MDO8996915.1 GDSL-type esterase/lipase family protein [Sediminibacterium sp.]
MRKWISLSLLLASFVLMSFTLNKKKKVVFFGDSITQMGAEPGGYIRLMEDLIKSENQTNEFELVGAGISGNKVTDLYMRLEKDVLSKQPQIVLIYIGINDIWHKRLAGTGTDYVKYTEFYDAIVKKLQAANIQVVVCTPSVIGERKDHSNEQDGELNMYSNWLRNYAKVNQLPCVDLRTEFQNYLIANNPSNVEKGLLTSDRVHLNAKGNQFVAEAIWKTIKDLK